jgi:hypothetical protein
MMMRRRPLTLLALSIVLAGVAIAYPIQIMILYDHGLEETGAILAKLAPFNWMVMIGSLVCSVLAFRASPQLWTAFPLLTVVVAWNNMLVSEVGDDYSSLQTSLATLGFASLGGLLFTEQAWEILNHPEKRWWRRPARKQVTAPVFIIPQHGEAFRAETFDISSSGAFIRVNNSSVRKGDKVSLRLTMGALTVLRCEAQIVRSDSARGLYPSGVGIQFKNLNRYDARELRKYLRSY